MKSKIFMIHGMWGGGWIWDKFKSYFEKNSYNCVTPYLRHHNIGSSDPAPIDLGKTTLLDYARDLELEVRKLPEKPIIIGHSMGGLLAQILGSRGIAKAVVLISPAPPAQIASFTFSGFRSFQEILLKWGFWRNPHKISYKKAVYSMMNLLPRDEREYIFNKNVWESGRVLFEIGLGFLGVKGAQVDASKLTCPLLVISGSQDKIIPAKVIRKIAKRYDNCTYKEYKEHAHWTIREPGWENIAEYVHGWLKKNT